MLIQEALRQIRELQLQASRSDSQYSRGYADGVGLCEEIITSIMWEEGVDEEDEEQPS